MRNDAEIDALVRCFEDGSLPRPEWTHEAHLVVALWYMRHHPRDEATRLLRDGIRRYNRRHGREAAYHETMTLAWVAVIGRFLSRWVRNDPISQVAGALLEACGDKDHLLRYYSVEVLLSDDARGSWVPPDRMPFD